MKTLRNISQMIIIASVAQKQGNDNGYVYFNDEQKIPNSSVL